MSQLLILSVLAAFATALPTNLVVDPEIDVNGDWRVVGGSAAPARAYPFIVSIRNSSNEHFCSGTILNSVNILTAGHCIHNRTTTNTIVVAGTNTLITGGVRRSISRLIVHPNYNDDTIANDIGIVKLSRALSFSNSIAIIPLMIPNNTGSVAAILIGWGRISHGGPLPNNLQHLRTQTITNAKCQSSFASRITGKKICSLTRAGQGACKGDSGGPLIQSSIRAQIGIVSFGGPCATGAPDVYTRVSAYLPWIKTIMAS